MWETAQSQRPNVLPFIRCRDPARSIEWLCRALGFETHYVALRDDGSIVFAHLRFGGRLIMVTPADDAVAVPAIDTVAAEGNALITRPAEIEDDGTQSCYFVVDDIEAHYRNAKEAGADIVLEIEIYEQGDCRYSCRDPDGHVWTFGTYNVPAAVADPRVALPATVGVLTVLAACGLALWLAQAPPAEEAASTDAEAQTVAAQQAEAKLTEERYAREASERALSEARERLSREQESREAAERAARLAAEEASRAAQEELARARDAAAAAAEQPTEAVSQTAPADGEPKAQIGERAVVTQPADETATKEAASKSAGQDEDRLASSLLAEGRSLLAKGDLDGARRAFRRAADSGLAEGALALGSTYDPASLARFGLKGASADGEPKARIGESAVVTQPADETARPAANAESEKLAEVRAARLAAEEASRAAQEELARARDAAAAAEQPTEAVSQTAPADGEPKAQIGASAVVTQPADETAQPAANAENEKLAARLPAEETARSAQEELARARDAATAAAEQPTEVASQTAPADGEPKARIGERAVATPPADETATKEAAPKSAGQREDKLASSLLAKGDAAAAAAAEQPTEAVSQTAPADGEPKARIGERVVVTPPVDESATQEAAPKSVGQDEDQLASSLLAEGRSLLAKGDLDGARRAFRRAADSGLAEGALALGSTYDPASLARYGLKGASADPESAKFWYRRAHELTQAAALKTKPVARE